MSQVLQQITAGISGMHAQGFAYSSKSHPLGLHPILVIPGSEQLGWVLGQTCQVAPEELPGCRLSVRMNLALKRPLPLLAPPSASLPFMRSASCSFT